jgi:hypothetical protein
MVRRVVDISAPLQNDVPADPPGLGPEIARGFLVAGRDAAELFDEIEEALLAG